MLYNTNGRISFIDGLRGIAILLVVLFHAFARWPNLVLYGDAFSKFPLCSFGWLGVYLFFMISGFVILMTLEKCSDFRGFIIRRWLRLFPAMLVCTLIIFVTSPIFPERPAGAVFFRDMFSGLTFIEPSLWSKLFGSNIKDLEGAFWSLYVEVKFYIFFGILYFFVGWRKAVGTLIGCFIVSAWITFATEIATNAVLTIVGKVLHIVGANYFGWFVSGALYYKYWCDKKQSTFVIANILVVLAALVVDNFNWSVTVAAITVASLFFFSVTNLTVRAILSNPVLLFLGFVSYPLYLIHENMMVAMIIKVGAHFPWIPLILLPIAPILAVIGLSWFVACYCEPWVKDRLRFSVRRFATRLGAMRKV